jgi:hypothetical protein
MAHPIDVQTFRSFKEQDRETVLTFLRGLDGIDVDHCSVIQVTRGGIKSTEYLLNAEGKRYVTKGTNDAATVDKFVACSPPYEVARILEDMAERAKGS